MKAYQMGTRTRILVILATINLLTWIVSPPSAQALMAMPDIGINYQTMKVTQAEKLIAAGMKDVRNGDGISLRTSSEGKLLFKNLRTNEELVYPPAKQNEKVKGRFGVSP